jgi:diguanylate cyclase (GGDEF)-like protein
MATPLRLLLIEDSDDDAVLVIRELTRAGYEVSAERVDSEDALRAALNRTHWDLVIADHTMPGFSGVAALAVLRDHDAEMPFIFVSGTIGEDAAVAAMQIGAHDYIMKGSLKRLVPAVARELREAANRQSRKRAEIHLAHLASHDALTDLPNRVLLFDRLQQALLEAQRAGEPLALMVLDLDSFKPINDSLGHQAGDRVLKRVASQLRVLVRDIDTVARLGGDEFAILLPRTDATGAIQVARTVLAHLRQPQVVEGRELIVDGRFGIAQFPDHGATAELLLQKADIAMYVAKTANLGLAVYAQDRDRGAHGRLALVTELRAGIERREFHCAYQPIFNLRTNEVMIAEALARWNHPDRGFLPPSEFVDIAEQTGLIESLTFLILDRALAEWVESEPRLAIPVAVNLSARHLRDPELPDRVLEILERKNIAPQMLVLEITENCIMADPARSTLVLSRLHEMGVKLAIDDFGTGYSSLGYLQRLPLDELKIDRSFVSRLSAGSEAIVRSIIELAHNLGLTVVAEGVESAAVRDCLLALGCDAAQGIFLAEPGSADDIRQMARHPVAEKAGNLKGKGTREKGQGKRDKAKGD